MRTGWVSGNFYVGLNYSPASSKVRDFEIRESNGETRAVFPYLKNGKRVELKANNFDWNTQDAQNIGLCRIAQCTHKKTIRGRCNSITGLL